MKPRHMLLFGLATVLLALTPRAHADTMYTSPSTFAAATTGDSNIIFTAPSSTTFSNVGSTYTDAGTGTTFRVASGTIDVTGKNYYKTGAYSSDFIVGAVDAYAVANTLTINLPAGDSAFGFDIGGLFAGETFNATLSDGQTFAMVVPASFNTTFIGFTAPGGISSLSFGTPANETFAIVDAVIGSVAAPEPSSLPLLVTGLLGLAGMVLARRKLISVD